MMNKAIGITRADKAREKNNAKGLREAREYVQKLLVDTGSHEERETILRALLVGINEEPEFDAVESRNVAKLIGRF